MNSSKKEPKNQDITTLPLQPNERGPEVLCELSNGWLVYSKISKLKNKNIIYIYDPESHKEITTIEENNGRVLCLPFDKGRFAYGFYGLRGLKMFDPMTQESVSISNNFSMQGIARISGTNQIAAYARPFSDELDQFTVIDVESKKISYIDTNQAIEGQGFFNYMAAIQNGLITAGNNKSGQAVIKQWGLDGRCIKTYEFKFTMSVATNADIDIWGNNLVFSGYNRDLRKIGMCNLLDHSYFDFDINVAVPSLKLLSDTILVYSTMHDIQLLNLETQEKHKIMDLKGGASSMIISKKGDLCCATDQGIVIVPQPFKELFLKYAQQISANTTLPLVLGEGVTEYLLGERSQWMGTKTHPKQQDDTNEPDEPHPSDTTTPKPNLR